MTGTEREHRETHPCPVCRAPAEWSRWQTETRRLPGEWRPGEGVEVHRSALYVCSAVRVHTGVEAVPRYDW